MRASRDPLAPVKKRRHADLKRAVMKALNLLPGVFVFPCSVGSFRVGSRFVRMGMKGTPDLVGWWVGCSICGEPWTGAICSDQDFKPFARFVALEIKAGKDTLRPEQRAFLDKVREAGGIALEVRDVETAVKAVTNG